MHGRHAIKALCGGCMLLAWSAAWAGDGSGIVARDIVARDGATSNWRTTSLDLGVLQAHTTVSLQPSESRGSRGVRVLGNYFFDGLHAGAGESALPSGFRASTGLLFSGRRATLLVRPDDVATGDAPYLLSRAASTTYMGIGYTSSLHRSGWGFSADLGIAGSSSGAGLDPYAGGNGSSALDDVVHALRLSPSFQLDVNYAF